MKHFIYILLALLLLTACGGNRWHDGEKLMNRGKAFMLDGQRDSAFVCFSLVANRYSENMCDSDKRMENSTDRRGKDSPLISDKQAELRQKIQSVLDDISTITSPAFNLSRLAELVGSNTTYVSRIVNDVYGKNLSTLLSDLRIKEACRRINNPEKYGQFTLETISASVGFKSRSTFLTSFKRVTGLLPSEFLRIAKRKE